MISMKNIALRISLFLLIACAATSILTSCASQPTPAVEENTPAEITTDQGAPISASQSVPESNVEKATDQTEQVTPSAMVPTINMTEIGESCKQQAFVEYEKQAREHIQRGWEATQAERFGVGFRDTEEYEKWSDTHNKLFSKVSDTCIQLSNCIKQNSADKEQKCASEAQRFENWQSYAKRFADKVKIVESSQPPMLCSLAPTVDEPTQCYALLADQIEKTCQTQECKDAAGCFRGVYFLDDAINQAKLACGFVGQELSKCRGYVEASSRRKAEVEQCLDQYNQLQVEILPVI